MQAKVKKFQIDVTEYHALAKELQFPGLVVLEVYAGWAGPCRPIDPIFRNHSVDLIDRKLHFVRVASELVPWLRRFHGRCRPAFLFVVAGQLRDLVVGLDMPRLDSLIPTLAPTEEQEAEEFDPSKYFLELDDDELYRDTVVKMRDTEAKATLERDQALNDGLDTEIVPEKEVDALVASLGPEFSRTPLDLGVPAEYFGAEQQVARECIHKGKQYVPGTVPKGPRDSFQPEEERVVGALEGNEGEAAGELGENYDYTGEEAKGAEEAAEEGEPGEAGAEEGAGEAVDAVEAAEAAEAGEAGEAGEEAGEASKGEEGSPAPASRKGSEGEGVQLNGEPGEPGETAEKSASDGAGEAPAADSTGRPSPDRSGASPEDSGRADDAPKSAGGSRPGSAQASEGGAAEGAAEEPAGSGPEGDAASEHNSGYMDGNIDDIAAATSGQPRSRTSSGHGAEPGGEPGEEPEAGERSGEGEAPGEQDAGGIIYDTGSTPEEQAERGDASGEAPADAPEDSRDEAGSGSQGEPSGAAGEEAPEVQGELLNTQSQGSDGPAGDAEAQEGVDMTEGALADEGDVTF